MTVSTDNKSFRYEGNGVTDTFAFNGRIFTASDLAIDILTRATNEIEETLSTSDYTVSIVSDESAEIIVSSGKIPSATQDILIYRDIDREQNLRLPTGTVFPAKDIEDALDKVTILVQDVASDVERVLKYPLNVAGITSTELPTPEDGKALVFDGTTGKIITSSDYITDAIADATAGVTGTALVTATSATSLTVTGTGSKIWTIQSGRGFAMGQRLRASSDDGTKINEGIVVSYSGTSLTINVDYVSGSGTHADWNISVTGDRGSSGSGSGDMLAANNLSDVASKPTAFATIKQAATTTDSGVVELATDAETITGTDTGRAVTPAGLKAALNNAAFVSTTTATTSGTTVDINITGSPKQFTVNFEAVSVNNTATLMMQLGTSGSFETTGYNGIVSFITSAVGTATNSTGQTITTSIAATGQIYGSITFTLVDSSTNTWAASGNIGDTVAGATFVIAGSKSLSGALTRIRLTTVAGTAAFDAGKFNVVGMY